MPNSLRTAAPESATKKVCPKLDSARGKKAERSGRGCERT
jgi:hypothetical protein